MEEEKSSYWKKDFWGELILGGIVLAVYMLGEACSGDSDFKENKSGINATDLFK